MNGDLMPFFSEFHDKPPTEIHSDKARETLPFPALRVLTLSAYSEMVQTEDEENFANTLKKRKGWRLSDVKTHLPPALIRNSA